MARRSKIPFHWIAIAAAGAVGLAAALAGPSGCTSDCGSNCPPNTVYVGTDSASKTVPYFSVRYDGPACPSGSGYCLGNTAAGTCHHFTVTGRAEGMCDVVIGFTDRDPEVLHLQFGPPIHQGCCSGQQIVGPETYIIPTDPNAVVYGVDGGADVTVLVDGGAGGSSGADAGSDAAAD